MNWLQRIFSLGRLGRAPKGQNAGRFLPPASVQRAHLGLRSVDLPAGVVTLRSGEVRAILSVSGVPLHHRSETDARAFLTKWAAAINALPAGTTWLVRSRKGVREAYLQERKAQAARLAAHAPGSALARLGADQLAHVRQVSASGPFRHVDNYLAVRHARGDVHALLAEAEAARALVLGTGIRCCALLRDQELAEALAWSWHPEGTELHYPSFSEGLRLVVWGRTARVEDRPTPGAVAFNGSGQAAAERRALPR